MLRLGDSPVVPETTRPSLPEATPYPALHQALAGLLDAVEAAPAARGWAVAAAPFSIGRARTQALAGTWRSRA